MSYGFSTVLYQQIPGNFLQFCFSSSALCYVTVLPLLFSLSVVQETKEWHFPSHKRGDLICSQEGKKTVSILS